MADLEFRRDLYQGTARYYDQFRVPYPRDLTDDLARRSGAIGGARFLDLACGTGQLAFALHGRFGETWAVDQDSEMIGVVREKAQAAGIGNIRAVACAAEDLSAPAESFDLIVIGTAFHRLPRQEVAARAFRWLRPGRCLALAWSPMPWHGEEPWQRAMSETLDRWTARAGAGGRIPPQWDQVRRERPDQVILAEAGFLIDGSYHFSAAWEWTPEALTGCVFSTSVLSRAALGGLAPAFEEDLRRELRSRAPSGRWRQEIGFAYDLVRRPAG